MKKYLGLVFLLLFLFAGSTLANAETKIMYHSDSRLYISSDAAQQAFAVVSSFDDAGKPLDVNAKTIDLTAGTNIIGDFNVYTDTAKTVKAFLFESGETLKPLCAQLVQTLSEPCLLTNRGTIMLNTSSYFAEFYINGNLETHYTYNTTLSLNSLTAGSVFRPVFGLNGTKTCLKAVYPVDITALSYEADENDNKGTVIKGGEVLLRRGAIVTLGDYKAGKSQEYDISGLPSDYFLLITKKTNGKINVERAEASYIQKNYYDADGNLYPFTQYSNYFVVLSYNNGELWNVYIFRDFLGR